VAENGRVDQTIHENQPIETWEMYGRGGIGFNALKTTAGILGYSKCCVRQIP
jgi:hypothetical protein